MRLKIRLLKIIIAFIIFVAIVSLVFHNLEGWGWVDSVYFIVTSVTTVGYGDIVPQSDAGKIVTIFVILTGMGFAFYVVSLIFRSFSRVGFRRRNHGGVVKVEL